MSDKNEDKDGLSIFYSEKEDKWVARFRTPGAPGMREVSCKTKDGLIQYMQKVNWERKEVEE